MPCLDTCPDCGKDQFNCRCLLHSESEKTFNIAGALCDVLFLVQDQSTLIFNRIDPEIIKWWNDHTKNEEDKIKKQALAKLTPRERKVLGL
tara:strand:+ start:49 stop:321 length:273 start_codon:yes stop_codon:yes gene_type:complete